MSSDDKKNETDEADMADVNEDAAKPDASTGSVPASGDNGIEAADAPETADAVEAAEDTPPVSEAVTIVQNAPARSDGFARFVAVIALLVAVAVLALSQFPQVPQGSAARLAAVEGQVAGLSPQPAAQGDETLRADIDRLRGSLAAAQEKLGNLSLLLDEMRTSQEKMAADSQAGASTSAAVESRIEDLVAQLAELEARPAPATNTVTVQPAAPAISAEVEAGISDLMSGLATLRSELARIDGQQGKLSAAIESGDREVRDQLQASIQASASDLASRLNDVAESARQTTETGNNQLAGKAALVLAAGRLKDAAAGSAPFDGAWQAVTSLGIDASAYSSISEAANAGVLTLADLKQAFPDKAARTIVADKVGEGGGWVDGALKRVGSLVKVRRTGELEGSEVEAVIARAEVRLNQDNLAGALAELEMLEGAAAAEMADWVAQAKARISLSDAVDALQTSLLSDLAGTD